MSTLTNSNPEIKQRNLADYHPNIWGEYFIQYASESMELDQNIVTQIDTLKSEVRNMLVAKTDEPFAKVKLVDSICRLGVSYHFEKEIDDVLQQVHKSCVENGEVILEDNLFSLAVLFRVLRQQGFYVSPNVFTKFKDKQGNFNETLITDVEGMLSLYEASHMIVHEEDILEEALGFTSTHLESIATQLNHSLAEQVKYASKHPIHKNLPRLEARHYISIYEQDPSHNEILLTFSKLDFNLLQSLHQKEFGNICKWWKELDFSSKLPYARDRIVECSFWSLIVYFEPQYPQARKMLSKVNAILSFIDDTYDSYGTIDELELFTEAIERWDIDALNNLPDYMKLLYKSFWNVYEEIEQAMIEEGREYILNYYKKEFKKAVQAYMTEARWLNKNYIPTTEEYMSVSTISCCSTLLILTSYIGMGDTVIENIFNWLTNEPIIANAAATICRVMDEIVSSEFEHKRGHVCSLLDCYIKQYGMTREAAIQECQKRVAIAWKDINKECLRPTEVPMDFLTRALNFSRFMDVFYTDKDNYTHVEGLMKTYIKDVLVDPIPI
ncbi:sesquiterpene synthase [Medicago truncatula]|uniref:(E)-beta-ocimene synthase n=1 Tax=Medicago truncatula TaxID=3880 RepID=A0A072U8B8_MEDTR|nr:sesquiterpene synthase [Medicago truncatula]